MTHKRFLLAYAVAVPAGLALGHWLVGGPGVLVIAIAAILALVSRLDNHTGSCLLITIVLLVVVGMLLVLMMLMLSMRGR